MNYEKHLENLNKISSPVTKDESDNLFKIAKKKYKVKSYLALFNKFFEGHIDLEPDIMSKIALYRKL